MADQPSDQGGGPNPTNYSRPSESLLAEALGAESTDDESLISRIQEEAQRVARTIDDLMILSYVEGEPTTDERLDIGAVVTGAVERISEAAAQRQVEVRFPDPTPSEPIQGSAVQLESAVLTTTRRQVSEDGPQRAHPRVRKS